MEDFFKKIDENFVGTQETVCNIEVFVLESLELNLSP